MSYPAVAAASRTASLALKRSVVSIGLALGGAAAAAAATYTVTSSLDDGGSGTLRYVIHNANYAPGSTIRFGSSLNGSTITLQSGQIPISTSMTVQGPGANQLTITGNNASSIFQIYTTGFSPPAVTISGLTLSSGKTADRGGAIYASNVNLTLQNAVMTGNSAHDGGAVYAAGGAVTTLNNVMMQGNSAASGGAFLFSGESSVVITNSTISGNDATICCGGGSIGQVGSVTISNVTVDSNIAHNGNGGGLAIGYVANPIQISGSVVVGNTCTGHYGGGVWIKNSDATVSNSRIVGNSASFGGGIYLHDARMPAPLATINVTSSTISGNSAVFFGGGIDIDRANKVTVGHTLIAGNRVTASGAGGGMVVRFARGQTYIDDSTVYGNYAYSKGGGIAITDSASGTATTLARVTIAKNSTNPTFGTVGAGVYSAGTSQFTGSIAANNFNGANLQDLNGTFTVNFSAVKTRGTATLTGGNNLSDGTDPQLGVLAVNGGPTLSMLPNLGSPVLDMGDPAVTPGTDQRGLPRVVNGRVDIGAVERQHPEDVIFRDGFESP
jgi:hypothetical protein